MRERGWGGGRGEREAKGRGGGGKIIETIEILASNGLQPRNPRI